MIAARRLSGVLLVLFLVAAPAAAQTTEDVRLEVVDGPQDEFVVTIDGKLLIPPGVSADSPAPVVVAAHGFGGDKHSEDATAAFLGEAGYVVFTYAARGFGDSTGEIGLDSIHYDVKDVRQIVDWLATRPEVLLDGPGDPRSGMIGPSYGGAIQLQVAALDDRLDAVVPLITWHSLISSLQPNLIGVDLDLQRGRPAGIFKRTWTSLFFARGTSEPVQTPALPTGAPSPCLGFVDGLCQAYAETMAAGRASEATVRLLEDSSPASRMDGIDVPALLVQGLPDTLFTPNEAAANFTALAARGVPVAMIWTAGGHGYPTPEAEQAHVADRTLRWFQRWLRDDPTVDTGPVFEWFQDWSPAPSYGSAGQFPVGDVQTWGLSADGTLRPGGGGEPGEVAFTSDPARLSYTETPNTQSQDPTGAATPFDPPGTFAAFTSDLLDAPLDVVGIPTAAFRIADALGEEAMFFGKLFDIAPDGTETLLWRQAAPVRAENLDTVVEFQLVGTAHRFPAGHRVKFAVAATDASYANRRTPTNYTLTLAPGESVLRLPVVGQAAAVPADEPGAAPQPAGGPGADGRGGLPATGATALATGLVGLLAGFLLRRRA